MKSFSVLCLFSLFAYSLLAQDKDKTKRFKYNNYYDLAVSIGKGLSIAPSWSHLHKIGKKGKFQVGYGVRMLSEVVLPSLLVNTPLLADLFLTTIDLEQKFCYS